VFPTPLCAHLFSPCVFQKIICGHLGRPWHVASVFLSTFNFPLCVLGLPWCDLSFFSFCAFCFTLCFFFLLCKFLGPLSHFPNSFCAHLVSPFIFQIQFGMFFIPFCAHLVSHYVFQILSLVQKWGVVH